MFSADRHPITDRPLRPSERAIPEAAGDVTHCVVDGQGRIVLAYADGHVFAFLFDKATNEIVCQSYEAAPAVTLQ